MTTLEVCSLVRASPAIYADNFQNVLARVREARIRQANLFFASSDRTNERKKVKKKRKKEKARLSSGNEIPPPESFAS